MSTVEKNITDQVIKLPAEARAGASSLSKFLKTLCSVRLGVSLLVLLALFCLIGMLIMQENVEGFINYYAALTPAQQLVYGKLDFFDIYHSWYFNTTLGILSLNIVLASIDRFPKTWKFARPKISVPVRWLQDQKQTDSFELQGEKEAVIKKLSDALKKAGWRKLAISEKNERTFVFAESGVWNRFGYLAVHVGLLTIFLGGFLTTQLGQTGNMPLTPGQTANQIYETTFDLDQMREVTKQIPFEITCTDIQQKLIKDDGSISVSNTIDWLTRFTIKDGNETHEAFVQMNHPFDYRGYRFFQASFTAIGRARNITVRLTPADGSAAQEDVIINRNGAVSLADGTEIRFTDFRGNFSIGKENLNEDTSNYPNPGAILLITPPGSAPLTAYAFGAQMANLPVAKKAVAGYTYQLINFEKVSDEHILSVQRDPGANVVYVGFVLLFLTLVGVFFFSHQRVWAALEETSENNFKVVLGGNTNRGQTAFDEKFKRFTKDLQTEEVQNI